MQKSVFLKMLRNSKHHLNSGYFFRFLKKFRRPFCNLSNDFDHKENCLHIPVLLNEVLKILEPKDNQLLLDMTFGAGGHCREILKQSESCQVLCLDRDPEAYRLACELSSNYKNRIIPLQGKFSEMTDLLHSQGIKESSLDGVLLDAGCSSMQMDQPERGFSLSRNGFLDMRMDGIRIPEQPTASEILNTLDEESLMLILKKYGEEPSAWPIARAIVQTRAMCLSIKTTKQLAEIVSSVINRDYDLDKIGRSSHVATRTFQAIRIFVNNELNELDCGIKQAYNFLKPGGKLIAITFHSLEDRIVKRHIKQINMDEKFSKSISQKYKNCNSWLSKTFVENAMAPKWRLINKDVITASDEEIETNPRCRSAKLRAAIKL